MGVFILLTLGLSFGGVHQDCAGNSISMEKAVEIAKAHVGTPTDARISRSRGKGECFWRVRGTEGYVVIDARSGKVIKFYRTER